MLRGSQYIHFPLFSRVNVLTNTSQSLEFSFRNPKRCFETQFFKRVKSLILEPQVFPFKTQFPPIARGIERWPTSRSWQNSTGENTNADLISARIKPVAACWKLQNATVHTSNIRHIRPLNGYVLVTLCATVLKPIFSGSPLMSWLVIATGTPDSVQAVGNAAFVMRWRRHGRDLWLHSGGWLLPTLRLDLNGRQWHKRGCSRWDVSFAI